MTEFKGYKSPRKAWGLFLTVDWTSRGLYDNFKRYKEDFEDSFEAENVDEEFWMVGDRKGKLDLNGLLQEAYSLNSEVALAEMELEAEGVEGVITYETHLSGEGAGRIEASFEVSDPELEEEVDRYVSEHFDSFLGVDLGYNPVQALR